MNDNITVIAQIALMECMFPPLLGGTPLDPHHLHILDEILLDAMTETEIGKEKETEILLVESIRVVETIVEIAAVAVRVKEAEIGTEMDPHPLLPGVKTTAGNGPLQEVETVTMMKMDESGDVVEVVNGIQRLHVVVEVNGMRWHPHQMWHVHQEVEVERMGILFQDLLLVHVAMSVLSLQQWSSLQQ